MNEYQKALSDAWVSFASAALNQALAHPQELQFGDISHLRTQAERDAVRSRFIQEQAIGNVEFAATYADAMSKLWRMRFRESGGGQVVEVVASVPEKKASR